VARPARPARPRHDRDAGGDAGLLAAKAAVREEVWASLSEKGVFRFPGPYGRIPNFTGAEAAARRLAETEEWQSASTVKANPDAPQWPVRQRALEDGKTVYMAVPRLAEARPFFLLDPTHLKDSPRAASSIKGASRSARTVDLDELKPVDLVVGGCVAVGEDGARLGKGGGFSDLEFAIASAAGLIGARTVVATTVHERQVLPSGRIPTASHDTWVDLIVTPDRIIRAPRHRGAARIDWEDLTEEKVRAIPVLARFRT
jgi:5-formyltetrahydrofolate cyclo-ligase